VIDIKVNRFPIVLLANYRTGGSALAIHLAQKYNIKYFSEPFQNIRVHIFDQHKKDYVSLILRENTSNFLVKFAPIQISELNNYEKMMNCSSFKIRLNRKNKVDQIVSLYIAEQRDKFFKLKQESSEKYSIPIHMDELCLVATVILRNDFLLRTLPYTYDLDLTYEDLGFIENTDHVLSDQPENIEEIREEVRRTLQLKWEYIEKNLNKKRERDCSLPLS